jgi:hypothetical protein
VRRILTHALVFLLGIFMTAPAELTLGQTPPESSQAPPASEESAPALSSSELESLVAPVALYPDPLLAQVFVASTYPLQVVEAQQWLTKNSSLKGDALTTAAEKQDWDPAVQGLVVFPELVKRMTDNIKWMTDMGNAFLADEAGVMDAVQRLRSKAKDSGKLESTEQQKVETKVIENKTVVEIQPASTQTVYVPTYNPTTVWGPPPYPYPSMYYPPYVPGAALFSFGMGVAMGAAFSGGWGYGCGWGGNNTVNINNNNSFVNNSNRKNNVSNRSGNSQWQHNSKNRGGVPYGDKKTAGKYGGGTRGESMSSRQSRAQGASSGAGNRGGGAAGGRGGASTMSAGGSRGGGGGNMGSRQVSGGGGSRGSSGAMGGMSSGSSARASSSRGSSSMRSSGGGGGRSGGGRSGGGGGGRRR